MARDKGRHEIALKLLEIYHARKSATAFETVAKELRGAVGRYQPAVAEGRGDGAQIDPTNPLYVAARRGTRPSPDVVVAGAAAPKPNLDFDLDSQSSAHSGFAPAPTTTSTSSERARSDRPSGVDRLRPRASAPAATAVRAAARSRRRKRSPSFDFDLSGSTSRLQARGRLAATRLGRRAWTSRT
jgi:pilus assembly protein FimV